MPNDNLTLAKTDTTALVANLRGEVGEVITTWLLMRHFIVVGKRLRGDDPDKDFADKNVQFAHLMADKLSDELVGRLSELAERKIGQLNFYFAATKLNANTDYIEAFAKFVVKQDIRAKRNQDVSHKAFPGSIIPQRTLNIPYRTLLRATAMALRLMKKLDRLHLGPSAPFLWREARKKRYDFMSPPRAGYMLVPYMKLSGDDRIQIVALEAQEGKEIWSEMPTTIDGRPTKILACKEWGVIVIGGALMALDSYPLIALQSMSTQP